MGVPISNVTRRVVYAASGTGPYNFSFEILAAGDIAVYKDDTLLSLTTNYTVHINTNGTGYVTLTASPTGATQIAIVGNRTIERTTDFVTGGDFFANTINNELDQQTIFAQQNAEGLARALQAPQTDPTSIDMTLPRASERAGNYLTFDVDGNPQAGVGVVEVAGVYAIADDVSTVAGIASNVTSVAGNATNITTVAGISTAVAAVGPVASSVSTVAGITSAVSTVAGISSNVTTVAGIASNVTTVAGISTAIATNASNITAIQNASTNATAAASSATAAASSATAASSAQTAAEAARDATLTAYDNFDDRYLGVKSSDPTVDNDGNALVSGSLYFNSGSGAMKVYTGSSWVAAYVSGTSYLALAGGTMTGTINFYTGQTIAGYQTTLVSGTSIKTVNSTSLLGSGNIAVQATLVSGTNIKTINGASILGSGDVTISSNPVGAVLNLATNFGGF